MLNRSITESLERLNLVEKYKEPWYYNTCYHGNADVCLNVGKFILEFQSRLLYYLTKGRISELVIPIDILVQNF